jgi:hypothetical protein
VNSSNTYYAISYSIDGKRYFVQPDWTGDLDVSNAERYQSVVSASQEATQNGWLELPSFAIVRVTETQTGVKAVVESTRVLDATKPCVVYNRRLRQYGVVRPDKTLSGVTKVENATVFTDLADAILALSNGALAAQAKQLSPVTPDVVHVHQVSLEPTYSYTYEVLA